MTQDHDKLVRQIAQKIRLFREQARLTLRQLADRSGVSPSTITKIVTVGLADYYKKVGIDVEYTDLLITTGGSEAILFAMMSCLDFGDEVIIPEPFYTNYNSFSTIAGINIIPISSTIETGFALPSIAEFEKSAKRH